MSTRQIAGDQISGAGLPPAAVQRDGEFQFGPFALFSAERRLLRSGQPVEIGDRALDVLILLAAQAPRVVSKAEIFDGAWPGVTVEDSALRYQLIALRRALGDGEDGARYIATVQGRGYALVAPVVRTDGRKAPATIEAKSNLPRPSHPLIGRQEEVSALEDELTSNRVVTLIGPGGVGKTRLAIEIGWRLAPRFSDGVWQVDLAPLSDPGHVLGALVVALKLGAAASIAEVAEEIAQSRMLIIFDNCEHLVGEVAQLVGDLMAGTSEPVVLATSQESLRIPEQRTHWLGPLMVSPVGVDDVSAYPAEALFMARAQQADGRFALTPANASAVADVCRSLDGLPLALEMAAARVPLLGAEGLRLSIGERLHLLRTSKVSSARHRSLRDLVEWSFHLLDASDQATFLRLAIFPGLFSLDAVVAIEAKWGKSRWEVIDALERLHEKSLISAEGDPPRYRLLETLRVWAREQLAASGTMERVADAHARYCAELMKNADGLRFRVEDVDWVSAYAPDLDNIRAALDWAFADKEATPLAVALAGHSLYLFTRLRLRSESNAYAERALEALDDRVSQVVASRVWRYAGWSTRQADPRLGLARILRAVELAREGVDKAELAFALNASADHLSETGEHDAAAAALDETRALLPEVGLPALDASVEHAAGILALRRNDPDAARHCFRRGVELSRASGQRDLERHCLLNRALAEFAAGDTARAADVAREFLATDAPADMRALMQSHLTTYLALLGDLAGARVAGTEALAGCVKLGPARQRWCLLQWALVGALEGRAREAAQLTGFIIAEEARQGQASDAASDLIFENIRQALGTNLPAGETDALMAEARDWTDAEALAFAQARLVSL